MSEDSVNTYKKYLAEPWFTLIKLGLKISEARVNKDFWSEIKPGDKVLFTNGDMGFTRSFEVTVLEIGYYPNFRAYLENEGLPQCLPGIDNMNIGLLVYRKYYTVEEEEVYGVISIRF